MIKQQDGQHLHKTGWKSLFYHIVIYEVVFISFTTLTQTCCIQAHKVHKQTVHLIKDKHPT